MELIVEKVRPNQRLDTYIGDHYPTISRSTIKKLIDAKVVSLNNEPPKSNKKLKEGDVINFDEAILKDFIAEHNLSEIVPTKMPLDIVYEDEDILVLNKDEGVVVHPSYNHLEDTLMNGLTYYIQNSKDPFCKIRPVNRLDKETSGIILFSKNLESHNFYTRQFKKREVVKEYLAVVQGDFNYALRDRPFINITSFITKSPEGFIYENTSDSLRGEYAETDIYLKDVVQKDNINFSFLKVIPHTGRTHQIRVHLKSLGYSIVGDTVYDGAPYKRMLLHSYSLKIQNREGETLTFKADPKNWFEEIQD